MLNNEFENYTFKIAATSPELMASKNVIDCDVTM